VRNDCFSHTLPACHQGSAALARLALVRHARRGDVPNQSDADQAEQPQ
jgi:hypothetical protein